MVEVQDFFAQNFGGQEALRLIGEVIVGIQRGAFGQALDDLGAQRVQPLALERGDRNVRGEIVQRAIAFDQCRASAAFLAS